MLSITRALRICRTNAGKNIPIKRCIAPDNRFIFQNEAFRPTMRFYCKCPEGNSGSGKSRKEKVSPLEERCLPNMMNDLPKPDQPWEKEMKKQKSRYTRNFLIGLAMLAMGLIGVSFLNYTEKPKKTPTPVKTKKKRHRVIPKNPEDSCDIPKNVPYLLIGGGTASFSAFRAIKSADPKAKVLVISNEGHLPYMRPPLSKEMFFNEDEGRTKKMTFKQWNGSERSLFYEPKEFYTPCEQLDKSENGGVAVATGWTVTEIDVVGKSATLEDGYKIYFNKCLIATGASPIITPVFEAAMADPAIEDKVKVFRNIYDFEDVLEMFEKDRSTAVIGGGFLGSELACALARIGKLEEKTVYQIFREAGNMGRVLPEYLSKWTTQKVISEGVKVITFNEIKSVKKVGLKLELGLTNGKKVLVDNVVLAAGVEPNTQLAEKSLLEVDPDLGGFLVNTELQARTDLYIAGDCACFYDTKYGRRRVEHHDHAVVTGRLAGENMAGGAKPYLHQSMFWSDLGPDVGYEAIGIVDASLPTVAVFARANKADTPKNAAMESKDGNRIQAEPVPDHCDARVEREEKKEIELSLAQIPKEKDDHLEDYGKGIIFYLRDDVVVGIVLWNVFNRMSIARQVLKEEKHYDDLNEVAKLFNIHDD